MRSDLDGTVDIRSVANVNGVYIGWTLEGTPRVCVYADRADYQNVVMRVASVLLGRSVIEEDALPIPGNDLARQGREVHFYAYLYQNTDDLHLRDLVDALILLRDRHPKHNQLRLFAPEVGIMQAD